MGSVGYIVSIKKIEHGIQTSDAQEVLELNWSNVGDVPRNIPQGAFFYLDVASLDLKPDNSSQNVLWFTVSKNTIPHHMTYLLSGAGTFELGIKVAADNAMPVDRTIRFGFDPLADDLTFQYDS